MGTSTDLSDHQQILSLFLVGCPLSNSVSLALHVLVRKQNMCHAKSPNDSTFFMPLVLITQCKRIWWCQRLRTQHCLRCCFKRLVMVRALLNTITHSCRRWIRVMDQSQLLNQDWCDAQETRGKIELPTLTRPSKETQRVPSNSS